MSLDLTLSKKCDSCGNENDVCWLNITYNLSEMWRVAIGREDGCLLEIEVMSGIDASEYVSEVVKELRANPAKYRKFNPSNGWGNYEGLVSTCDKIVAAGLKHPDYIWEACR